MVGVGALDIREPVELGEIWAFAGIAAHTTVRVPVAGTTGTAVADSDSLRLALS
jgi:hypothetical protein